PKIGLGWRPVEDVLVRATWGTSFRPPTFRELFDPLTSYEDNVGYDPYRCPVTDDFEDCDFHLATGTFEGNPDLQPDEGDSWLIGAAWEPSSAPGLTLALDYWSIEHRNRIVPSYEYYENFLFGLPPDENPFVQRAPQTPEDLALGIPGVIVSWTDTYINADSVGTNGIDINFDYHWEATGGSEFSSGITYTWLNEYSRGFDYLKVQSKEDVAGRFLNIAAAPKNRANLRLGWSLRQQAVSAVVNYVESYRSPANLYVDGEATDTPFYVDDYWQLDLQYSYVFAGLKNAKLQLGCHNCLAADPPVYNYINAAEAFHEGRGVLFYLRWTQPFE
ncbi:MAG: TonB-dependent receptor domain-containing protein, partial [Lysobacterales bacterium]